MGSSSGFYSSQVNPFLCVLFYVLWDLLSVWLLRKWGNCRENWMLKWVLVFGVFVTKSLHFFFFFGVCQYLIPRFDYWESWGKWKGNWMLGINGLLWLVGYFITVEMCTYLGLSISSHLFGCWERAGKRWIAGFFFFFMLSVFSQLKKKDLV